MTKTLSISELREKLQKEEVKFTFTKKSGELREALGTLNYNKIPEDKKPSEDSNDKRTNLIYFDLDKNDWRSLPKDASTVEIK
ncbi:MAG: SH3 beta-barrel fold-containing protein [bacterium]